MTFSQSSTPTIAEQLDASILEIENRDEWNATSLEALVYWPENSDEPMTKAEFLELCEGDSDTAYRLFCLCEWQHPATLLDEDGGLEEFRKLGEPDHG